MEANLDDIIAQEGGLIPLRLKKDKAKAKEKEPKRTSTPRDRSGTPRERPAAKRTEQRKEERRERLAAARGESGAWLEASGLGEQAEAWMDSIVASGRERSVSARSVSGEARSRKVSFEGDEAEAEE